jgi:hypothetical protein
VNTGVLFLKINLNLADVGLLDCDAVWTCRWVPTFPKNKVPPPSRLEEEVAVCFFKTLVPSYKTTRCQTTINIFTTIKNLIL